MAVINQKEYIKKYLSIGKDDGKKKKKKKKPRVIGDGLRIVDDDLDISNAQSLEEAKALLETNEDAPQVVGVIDERPMALRIDDYRKSDRWKVIGEEDNDSIPSKTIDEDNSPPRRNDKTNDKKQSSSYQKHRNEIDCSPPRRNDKSPPPRRSEIKKEPSDSDNSPPRKGAVRSPLDNSRTRKSRNENPRNNYDSDNSPPRQRNKRSPDISPPRRHNRSPLPYKNKQRSDRRSPARRYKSPERSRRNNDSDNCPPRKRNRSPENRRVSDNSPQRRKRYNDSPPSPWRNRKPSDTYDRSSSAPIKDGGKHESPVSKRKAYDADNGPPRRNDKTTEGSGNAQDRMTKTLDGKAAGLQNAKELNKETELFKKREDEHFRNLPAEISGVNAATVVRDRKTGKIRDMRKEADDKKVKQKRDDERKEKYSRWGKGLKQVEDKQEKLAQDIYEMSKPLARYAGDEDLEKYLKEQEREGDPMLAYIRSKKKKEIVASGKPMKPQYDGEYMPNRYGIAPGHRWDGVDRSNTYETRWFEKLNAKKAQEEETYKWSTEDM